MRMNAKNMKTIELKKLRKAMEKEQTSKRFEHTLAVAYTAASLAMVHEEDSQKALIAGMLHDCAKCLEAKKLISICRKNNLEMTETELKNPSALLHAKVGCFLAEEKYDITDTDILNAIKYHTTGRPEMSRLEKILYIADYMEPGRKHAANLVQIRKMAYLDLDKTLLKILEDTLAYLQTTENQIDDMTLKTYQYYNQQGIHLNA